MSEKEGKNILLVDDDELLLDMYSTKFKEKGYEVRTAGDGKTAVRFIMEGFIPDAILIDVVMPGIDGFELLSALKKVNGAEHSALIMLSNQGQDADLELAKKLGADGYIVKASTVPSEVVTKVADIIGKNKK